MTAATASAATAGGALRRDALATLLPGFEGPDAPGWLLDLLREGLGGVCLFGSNVVSAAQLRTLVATLRGAGPESVVAIDEEGGDVTRLHAAAGSPYPGNALLGRLDDVALTERVARAVGEALADVGVTLTFAPDADVNSNASNPVIGVRSFGADPALAARHTAAWVRGVQASGVAASAKHFPGHGDTAEDSHLALPVVDLPLAELTARELVPFRAAIEAGTRTIMTSHILLPQLDPGLPATLSPRILGGLLRDELGFEGVIVSDALDMRGASGERGIAEAAVLALAAGCDLLCIGTDVSEATVEGTVAAVERAVADGRLARARVAEAAARVRELAATAPAVPAAPTVGEGHAQAATAPDDAVVAPAMLATAFDLRPGALDMLAGGRIGTVVRVDTVANIAVGGVPWGPFAAEAAASVPSWLSETKVEPLAATRPLTDPAGLEGPVLVIGKDLHRHAFAVAAVDALRAARDDVVTCDLGWPGEDRAYADVATFGASRLAGRAFIALIADALAGKAPGPGRQAVTT
ncbi:glycoside hydrolase family 3 protein [Agromyces aerolatus]|uniref:glycoside hydrolase family 3 protein n=1 Tax=Agromyces sp. LY-1074 TaxID=3074080 RepID=UPI00286365A8|nr:MULTISPECIES: glycoside hydrolase family 3 N-terminal domain-containing protein [unclassified Agromyces]MDR5698283.1 glycoside hydrolase family 3 N-terminal domain-containing protein [Agromyces sp. LY-1074]MDR5704577.1 glycoside hydrolase family 3 N-terminal domain-containing protein [Agromyces sp. LY-1358]